MSPQFSESSNSQAFLGRGPRGWLERNLSRFYAFRPRLRDWRFWVIIGLVAVIAFGHDLVEIRGLLPDIGMLYLLPVSLFLVPVIFAALNFGRAGAVGTAALSTVAVLPDWILHSGLERLGVAFQMAVVFAVALILGQRVEREWVSRRRAETASAALRASNTRYRGLLESSPAAIMVLDPEGGILEANTAAGVLFSRDQAVLETMSLQDLLGEAGAEQVLSTSRGDADVPRALNLRMEGGIDLYIEPTLTEVADGRGDVVVQVVFRDATEERDRQSGLRAYAAHMIRAQEEERQRIARELHDETIQLLVLLHRRLDSLVSTSGLPTRGFAESVQEARDSAEELVRRLRDFATSLRPSTLDELGMVTSIRRAATDLGERNGIDARVNVVGEERRLPPHAELGLFRIAQEALWNVEHHARAGRLEVDVTFGEDSTALRVADNGVGFRVPAGSDYAASGQLGLISMQERARLLGGKVTIMSRPGKGTIVDASIPFVGAAPEPPIRGAGS